MLRSRPKALLEIQNAPSIILPLLMMTRHLPAVPSRLLPTPLTLQITMTRDHPLIPVRAPTTTKQVVRSSELAVFSQTDKESHTWDDVEAERMAREQGIEHANPVDADAQLIRLRTDHRKSLGIAKKHILPVQILSTTSGKHVPAAMKQGRKWNGSNIDLSLSSPALSHSLRLTFTTDRNRDEAAISAFVDFPFATINHPIETSDGSFETIQDWSLRLQVHDGSRLTLC